MLPVLEYLYKNKLAAVIIFTVIALIVYFSFTYEGKKPADQPATPPPVANVQLHDSFTASPNLQSVQNISVSTLGLKIPEESEMPVYSYSRSTYLSDAQIDDIFKMFNVKVVSDTVSAQGRIIIANSTDDSVIIEKDKNTVSYIKNVQNPIGNMNLHSVQEYQQKAIEVLTKLKIDYKKYSTHNFSFHIYDPKDPDASDVTVNEAEKANFIEIRYTAAVNKYPLLDKTVLTTPNVISVYLNSNFELQRLHVEDIGTVGDQTRVAKLKSGDEILQALQAGKAKIMYSGLYADSKITSIMARDISLGYYSFNINKELVPVYIIEGEAKFTSSDPAAIGQSSNVGLLLTAEAGQ